MSIQTVRPNSMLSLWRPSPIGNSVPSSVSQATEPPSECLHLTPDDQARLAAACGGSLPLWSGFLAGGWGVLAGGAVGALCGAGAVPQEHRALGASVGGGAGLLLGLIGARLPLPAVVLLTIIAVATAANWSMA